MIDYQTALSALRQASACSLTSFREGQWEAIEALVKKNKKVLVVQRTGWGKSLVYFLATFLLRRQGHGPTLIISPLLALMRNQIEAATRLGLKAASINSTNRADWDESFARLRQNQIDLLLISPERLANESFVREHLTPIATSLGLLVVDEAHCISDWGHDFRPDYRRLREVLRRIPDTVPVLATTATANDRVIADIREQLGSRIVIQRGPLRRDSLRLQTHRLPSQAERLAWLANSLPHLPGTGIIYTLTRSDAERVSAWLRSQGIDAPAYYSDVSDPASGESYRQRLEEQLLANRIKALVATSALGMGFDKPDLGFVVHFQAPGSVIAYYQQVGRAGRDGREAPAILLAGEEDAEIHAYFRRTAFPPEAVVTAVLDRLAASDGLTQTSLERSLNLRPSLIGRTLKQLAVENPAPVILMDRLWHRTPVAYRPNPKRIRQVTAQREAEWQQIEAYLDSSDCLMAFLGRALDDPTAARCGHCARCRGETAALPLERKRIAEATRFLRQAEMPLHCPIRIPADALSERALSGGLLPEDWRAETGRILSRWGDAGWGGLVAADKHRGHFRDGLVQAAAEMICHRWRPDPLPTWIAAVPSLRAPTLVASFASRLGHALGLPFVPLLVKSRSNSPQKEQQNRFHQCANLDQAFSLDRTPPPGPVLLVDDVVDSGWTLALIAALLRRAGSGPVWPFALATSDFGS